MTRKIGTCADHRGQMVFTTVSIDENRLWRWQPFLISKRCELPSMRRTTNMVTLLPKNANDIWIFYGGLVIGERGRTSCESGGLNMTIPIRAQHRYWNHTAHAPSLKAEGNVNLWWLCSAVSGGVFILVMECVEAFRNKRKQVLKSPCGFLSFDHTSRSLFCVIFKIIHFPHSTGGFQKLAWTMIKKK